MWSWGLGLKRNRRDNIKTGTWWALCREGILVWGTRCRQKKRRGCVRSRRWFQNVGHWSGFAKNVQVEEEPEHGFVFCDLIFVVHHEWPQACLYLHTVGFWYGKLVSTVNTWLQGYIPENHQFWITAYHEHTESDTWWQILKLKIPSKLISCYSSWYEPVWQKI